MATGVWAKGTTWEGSQAPSIHGASVAYDSSVRDNMLGKFTSTALRDAELALLDPGQREGSIAYVSGQGWCGYDGTTWSWLNETKRGRVDSTIEGNGHARIPSSVCFFNGSPPSVVIVSSSMHPQFTFSWLGLTDGSGVLVRAYDTTVNAYVGVGAAVAFSWVAFR